jgi:hypothetical protein
MIEIDDSKRRGSLRTNAAGKASDALEVIPVPHKSAGSADRGAATVSSAGPLPASLPLVRLHSVKCNGILMRFPESGDDF